MNTAVAKLGGAFAAYVGKVGIVAALSNPVTWVVAGTAIAGAVIYEAVKD
jgi:hypothetical protein